MFIHSGKRPLLACSTVTIAVLLAGIAVLHFHFNMLDISLSSNGISTEPPAIKQPEVHQMLATPIIVESTPENSTPTLPRSTPSIAQKTEPTPTPDRVITVNLSADPLVPTPERDPDQVPIYAAFDFLRGYLTNQTHPIILDGKPWENSTLNWEQYQQELGGVTYWDFNSEPENWDSPSYLWQDDSGAWRPYEKQVVRTPNGQETIGYVILDRQGPGVMDKIWFAEDAVWMLTTEQSRKDVGPIASMDEFLEWGNLEKLGNLRVQVDDRVAYDGPVKDWLSGRAWGLTPDLARILTWRHREYGSSGSILPVLYQKTLRLTLYGGSKKPKWFLATGIRFAASVRVKSYRGSGDLPIPEMATLVHNVLRPDEYIHSLSNVRAFDLSVQPRSGSRLQFNGQGTLNALELRIGKKEDPRQLWLRILYGEQMAINLPLIAFFSDQKQLVLHRSTPLGVVEDGETYVFYCNLPMPFQNGMTLELATNGSDSIPVSISVATSREAANTQLWVRYVEPEKTTMYGPDFRVQITGDGKLMGLVLQSDDQELDRIPKVYAAGSTTVEDPVKRTWPMGYLEGNLTLTDGDGNSRVFGGQEDWADAGFYFNRGYTDPPGGSNRPFGGILRYKDGKDGYATLFRYFSDMSAFRFKEGLTLAFGHGTWKNNFPVHYGTTVYYYRQVGK